MLYQVLQQDAILAEQLGFHSLWLAEHHFWYDGWCPAPVAAAAAVLGATSRLHAGTGVHLLPLWEPEAARAAAETLVGLAGGRLELAVGLGYRDEEYDGFGLARRMRGRRMDSVLDELQARWDGTGIGPRLLVGGFSEAAMRRAGGRGLGIFLPFSLEMPRLRATIERYRQAASEAGHVPGRIGMLKYAWATDGSHRQLAQAKAVIATSAREYSGAWFPLRGRPGFESPELLDAQLRRATETAFIGPPEQIASDINELAEAGVDLVVLQLMRDDIVVDYRQNMAAIAESVLPAPAVPAA
jgi:alkanesulfonate monooxygenase SsuD/methylene tetrahydromethanopterin reductase-like flavin-dependent oxidoreductase (luciferase family)